MSDLVDTTGFVGSSQQPQKNPGVSQVCDVAGADVCSGVEVVVVGSLHPPNHPGCSQVDVLTPVLVVVEGGPVVGGTAVGDGVAVVVVVVGSLQPNHPGV